MHLVTKLATTTLLLLPLLVVSACGGGGAVESPVAAKATSIASSPKEASAQTQAVLKQGAERNAAELSRAAELEKTPQSGATGSQRKAASGAAKFSPGTKVPVIRFYSATQSAHFYTASAVEAQMVRDSLLYMKEEGVAFYASSAPAPGLSPVFRYFNTLSYTHFYSISEDEKAGIDAYIPYLRYDGIAFYASKTAGDGLKPLYRFYQPYVATHMYTASAEEAVDVRTRLTAFYGDEGVAFYVIDPEYVASSTPLLKLPHSGVTSQQCFQAGGNALFDCASAGPIALNSQQDGHRAAVNPMAFSEVPKASGGNHARTECVKDNVTGLIWEGKEASEPRAGSKTYTNWVSPDQGDITATTNSLGYVNLVNSMALCGFTDWRMPTRIELQSIVDYAGVYPGPMVDTTWFPNTPAYQKYWMSAASPYAGVDYLGKTVDFSRGALSYAYRGDVNGVRLVRGQL